jgi:hypothetical protein
MRPLHVTTAPATPREAETRLPPDHHPTIPAPVDRRDSIDAIAGAGLRSSEVAAFFADQGALAKELTERPSSRSSDGDIPEFLHTEGASSMDDLSKQIGDYIGTMKRTHPEMFQQSGGSDVLSDWMMGEMSQQTEAEKKKFLEVLAMAKSPGDVILAMTQKHAGDALHKVSKLMGDYKDQTEAMDHLQAELDLKQSSGDLTQADMMQFNMKFSRGQGDTMHLFQGMQMEMNNYERVLEGGQSLNKSDNADETMVQNMRG